MVANNNTSSEVDYLHRKFYGEINCLKSAQKILRDIIDLTTSGSPDIQRKAKSELQDITAQLEKLYDLMPTISLIEAYDSIIKNNNNNDKKNNFDVTIKKN